MSSYPGPFGFNFGGGARPHGFGTSNPTPSTRPPVGTCAPAGGFNFGNTSANSASPPSAAPAGGFNFGDTSPSYIPAPTTSAFGAFGAASSSTQENRPPASAGSSTMTPEEFNKVINEELRRVSSYASQPEAAEEEPPTPVSKKVNTVSKTPEVNHLYQPESDQLIPIQDIKIKLINSGSDVSHCNNPIFQTKVTSCELFQNWVKFIKSIGMCLHFSIELLFKYNYREIKSCSDIDQILIRDGIPEIYKDLIRLITQYNQNELKLVMYKEEDINAFITTGIPIDINLVLLYDRSDLLVYHSDKVKLSEVIKYDACKVLEYMLKKYNYSPISSLYTMAVKYSAEKCIIFLMTNKVTIKKEVENIVCKFPHLLQFSYNLGVEDLQSMLAHPMDEKNQTMIQSFISDKK